MEDMSTVRLLFIDKLLVEDLTASELY